MAEDDLRQFLRLSWAVRAFQPTQKSENKTPDVFFHCAFDYHAPGPRNTIQNKEKLSSLSVEKDEEMIKELSSQIIKLGGKPNLENKDLKGSIKDLSRQLEQLSVKNVLEDKTKNIISDVFIKDIKVRFQKVQDLPPKDLRKLVDNGKKELEEGIIIVFAIKDDKVGIAVGVTDTLINKFDAVKFVKTGSEIIGGQGGGGRKDFAQAGGQDKSKIDEAFEKLKTLI